LGLDWTQEYKSPFEIEGFKYWYGDVGWGKIFYLSTEDILGLEAEAHLHFHSKKIYEIVLILGPGGLNNSNCFKKYSNILKYLNEKYGHYLFKNTEKDPLAEDLFYTSACIPVLMGLRIIDTIWKSGDMKITASLYGDEDGYYIEIEYIDLNLKIDADVNNKKKVLKKL